MPLCWAHAEYLTLVRSRKDGGYFDSIPAVRQRYAQNKTPSQVEMWTFAHQPPRIRKGKIFRLVTADPATIRWSFDGWKTGNDSETRDSGLGCWFADLPAAQLPTGAKIVFTFRWADRWEGRDFGVVVGGT